MTECEVDEKENEPLMTNRRRKGDIVLAGLRTICGMVAHLASVAFTVFIIYTAQPGTSLFSWHPTFMALAFSLMTEAILVFNPESSLFLKFSRKSKVRVHWLLQVSAVLCAIIGFATIFFNKSQNNKEHFTSWHGLFGVITVGYIVTQALCGIFLLYPQIPKRWNWKLIQLKVYHATFGLLGYTLACATIILALYSNFVTKSIEGFLWALCLFAPAWCALIIMNQVTNTYLPVTRRAPAL